MTKAHVFTHHSCRDPIAYGLVHSQDGRRVCVDRKVHLRLERAQTDLAVRERSDMTRRITDRYEVLGPCDGSCTPECELPVEAEELVRKFLASDGRELGMYEHVREDQHAPSQWVEDND